MKPLVAFFLLISFSLTACGEKKADGTADTSDNAAQSAAATNDSPASNLNTGLDGEWEIVKAEGKAAASAMGTVYTFNGGELSMKRGAIETAYDLSMGGDTLYAQYRDNPDIKLSFLKSMSGDSLKLDNTTADQTFFLIQK